MAVLDGDRFRAVIPADGEAFRGVSGLEEASDGALWLSEPRGVVFIPGAEISKALKDPSTRVHYQIFDARDGLPGVIQQFRPYPTSAQGTDGRIWFSTSNGVAWVNPAHVSRNRLPPPISIRSITTNGTRYAPLAGLKLPHLTRNLTIDYTALSLAVPERVRFRYKFEGSDTEWQDAGTRSALRSQLKMSRNTSAIRSNSPRPSPVVATIKCPSNCNDILSPPAD